MKIDKLYPKVVLILAQILVGYTSAFSVYMFMPFLKEITDYFHASPTQGQLLISAFFVGIAVPRLLYGMLSEKLGLKLTMIFGLMFFLLGGIFSTYVSSYKLFIIGRFLQGFGMSAAGVLGAPIICQAFREQVRLQSKLISIQMSVTSVAPVVAGFIIAFLKKDDWHYILLLTNLMIIICIVLYYYSLSTLKLQPNLYKGSYFDLFSRFGSMLLNKKFMFYTLSATLIYSAVIILVGWLPFISDHVMNSFTPKKLYFFLTGSLVLGGFLYAFYGVRYSNQKILLFLSYCMLLTLLPYLALHSFLENFPIYILFIMLLICAYAGVTMPICITGAIRTFKGEQYLASSLYSFFMNLFVAILTYVVPIIISRSIYNIVALFLTITAFTAISLIYLSRKGVFNETLFYNKG